MKVKCKRGPWPTPYFIFTDNAVGHVIFGCEEELVCYDSKGTRTEGPPSQGF